MDERRMRRRTKIVCATLVLINVAACTSCGSSLPRLGATEPVILELWREYLASKRGRLSVNAGAPSTLWLPSEQAHWPMYDLAGFYLPDGAAVEDVTIRRTASGPRSEYEIVTRFVDKGASTTNATPSAGITTTVYAVEEAHRWVLANALPRKTSTWRRERVGQVTYFIAPSLTFNAVKAQRAVKFIDSLAFAFELPRLDRLDYYVASSVDEALDIIGVRYPVKYGPSGGFAKPVNRQLFSGNPALGEEYRHELAHLVLLPLYRGGSVPYLASEGLATWLGGTAGDDYATSVRRLAEYLDANPTITLDSIITSSAIPQSARYTGIAVVCELLWKVGGTRAVREFLLADPSEHSLGETLARLLGRPWVTVVADWKTSVKRH
jgi:hypothetical protein